MLILLSRDLTWRTTASKEEKAMGTHSSTLAWKIPWAEEPGRLQSTGLWSRTQLSNFTFTFMHWRRKWQPICVLAWRIPGMGEPGGLLSMGSHRVRHHWSDLAAAAAASTEVSLVVAPEVLSLNPDSIITTYAILGSNLFSFLYCLFNNT